MNELKKIRKEKNITQKQAAEYVGVSLRSYKSYENEATKRGTIKYDYILNKLNECNKIDETHGVLDIETITKICGKICKKHKIDFCYLFGSYAKGKAKESSDVDLLIKTKESGLNFYGIVEEFRTALKKQVDVLNIEQLSKNPELIENVLKDGIKIYG